MQRLLARVPPPEHIVIETSGLALPKPLLKAFQWPEIRTRVTVDGVIAVVDAAAVRDGLFASAPDALEAQRAADPALDHDSPLEELFEEQLGAADLVVLNKADLLAEADWAAVEARVRLELRPGVRLVRCRPRPPAGQTCCSGSTRRRRAISPPGPRITTTARTTSTTISKASTSSVPALDDLDAFVARLREHDRAATTCCASRASLRCAASRCAWCCRAWAIASSTISIAPGDRTRRARVGSW